MSAAQCLRCGFTVSTSDEFCARCGAEALNPAYKNVLSTHTYQPLINEEVVDQNRQTKTTPVVASFRGVGDVFSPTISVFTKNFWFITKLVFVLFAPLEVFKALSIQPGADRWQTSLGTFCLEMVCRALIAPSLIYGIYSLMHTGVAPSLTECYRRGLSRLGKVVGSLALAWPLQALGTLALIVPGIILSLAFELIYPLATLENLGPVDTLKRSFALTKGYRGSIFVAGLALWLSVGAISLPVQGISVLLMANGMRFWPVEAALAIMVDVVGEVSTILSLMIYLGILADRHEQLPPYNQAS